MRRVETRTLGGKTNDVYGRGAEPQKAREAKKQMQGMSAALAGFLHARHVYHACKEATGVMICERPRGSNRAGGRKGQGPTVCASNDNNRARRATNLTLSAATPCIQVDCTSSTKARGKDGRAPRLSRFPSCPRQHIPLRLSQEHRGEGKQDVSRGAER